MSTNWADLEGRAREEGDLWWWVSTAELGALQLSRCSKSSAGGHLFSDLVCAVPHGRLTATMYPIDSIEAHPEDIPKELREDTKALKAWLLVVWRMKFGGS